MSAHPHRELYQQVILEHNKNPRNYGPFPEATHTSEGYNPLCGDHLKIFLKIGEDNIIDRVSFEGDGCAISRASASMMTTAIQGKTVPETLALFEEFQNLVTGKLDPDRQPHHLGKLTIFSGIWQFPSRVKCAILSWHALKGALERQASVSTE
ncbi:MAG TPA: SUF system NifU family Fe-S cluster assembly protein [Candidatus Omnitrophota bacterium]|nr:SUF system NifU family Fe-S cluster assembly protein [Candidatus Omnitrophota bacterium]